MKKFNSKGFTMVELLIVLAIIAILAAVAIPVYSSQLESSRRKVDEANLRAATGLAVQDYMLRNPSMMGDPAKNGKQRYLVFTLAKDGTSTEPDDSKNMLVYRENGTIDENGNYYEGHDKIASKFPNNAKPAIYTRKFNTGLGGDTALWDGYNVPITFISGENNTPGLGSGQINGKKVIPYPLQQNNGNARFDILIGPSGNIISSFIDTTKGKVRLG